MTAGSSRPDDWHEGYRFALAELTGRTIESVIYTDTTVDDGTPLFRFEPAEGRHSLCFGLALVTSDQVQIGITWDWDGDDYRLCVERSEGELRLHSASRFEVSTDPEWKQRIGLVIRSVTFSVDVRIPEEPDKICDCRIDFDGAPAIWISARDEDHLDWPNMDNIVVFFEREQASRAGVLVDA